MKIVKGYKVFNPDWTCRDKQYAVGKKFEEDIDLLICKMGMHFCRKLVDCFNYYGFNPNNKVAEVIAYGDVYEENDKCCTNKLKIVKEIRWHEVLEMVNTGDYNTGNNNTGDYNTGNNNTGDCNTSYYNKGYCNTGDYNKGDRNTGDYNTGNHNTGYYNTGDYNTGDYNTGDCNTGYFNTGYCNTGDYNTGNNNTGYFNTITPKMTFFNKLSDWTFEKWTKSVARRILLEMPTIKLVWINYDDMTEEEKEQNPNSEITKGYLYTQDYAYKRQKWWQYLSKEDKQKVMSLPNFDKGIFKEITGIDIDL